ncbi:MAG: hypothetical protein IJ565_05460 [Bacilli bacterium]|nr:hypothetical protein [Bacilli bacterium]
MYNMALELLKEIDSSGFTSYIVGGYPRDLYLNRASKDIDICTNATPKDLKDIFGDAMLSKVNYGSVTVIKDKIRFEITTFRKEIKYINNRKPIEIEYINDLEEDLKRRDFTINTLCIDSKGNIIDLLDGKKDIDNKIIKMVGNPKVKLMEDALRILRAIRFAVELDFKIDDELKDTIKEYGYLLKNLSYDRKKEELNKIFNNKNVRYGFDLIKDLNLDKPLELNIENIVPTEAIGIWAQLDVIDKYPFTKEEKNYINVINELKDMDFYDVDTLYMCAKYGFGYLYTICTIKGLDFKEIEKQYLNLPIKSSNDIDIKQIEIANLLGRKPDAYLKDIVKDIEYQILHNKLNNNTKEISEYILNTYK